MDQKAKAKAAWQRSLEVVSCKNSDSHFCISCWLLQNPSEWSAQLLLGLESINASKSGHLNEDEKAQLFLAGTKMIERAFQANNRSASAANALCELFLRKGSHARVRWSPL
jgi:RNA polymerase-associated protein CTR9